MEESNEHPARIMSRVIPCIATLTALLLCANAFSGEAVHAAPKVGEAYEISKRYKTSEQTSDGSSGSSSGRDTLIERVIGVREDGLELEFDLPEEATAQDRARNWQYPARILRSSNGSMQLLNRPDLEARIDDWLKAAGWTRAACGQWIFTWNAFQIECDPESVIEVVKSFDLRSPAIREGAPYADAEANGPGIVTRTSRSPEGATYVVELEIDPDAVRRTRAASDVAAGEILQKPVTLEAALLARSEELVTGTISVTIETDADGKIRRRTKVTKVETKGPGGKTQSQTATETVERRPIPLTGSASLAPD